MPDINRAIETCLDAQALRQHLLPLLGAQGPIGAVRITKAHRSASRRRDPNPLVFCCEVDRPRSTPLRWFGKLYRAGASAAAAQGTAALHVAALDLLLWPWPHDPGLPQLAQLLEPAATLPHWGAPADAVQALRYEPEKRALLHYTRADGAALYAKTYGDMRAQEVARRFAWMWTLSRSHAQAPRVARVLDGGADHTLWQEAVQGTALCSPQRGQWVLPLAQALAVLHAAPAELAGPEPRTTAFWLAEIRRRRKKISHALPELSALADATVHAIEQAAAQLVAHDPTLIHGDFHPDQVRFDGRRIVLFDFDEFTLGDPMEDLAEFVVKLPDGDGRSTVAALLLGAYAQAAPRHFCRARLAWHMAVQQLLQASRAFVFQVADWRGEVQRRLERAHQLALRLGGGEMVR